MNRLDVIAQHIHLGCWLDDVPGVVKVVEYYGRQPKVVVEPTGPELFTAKLGTPDTFTGRKGTVHTWEHPEGFLVEMFHPHVEVLDPTDEMVAS